MCRSIGYLHNYVAGLLSVLKRMVQYVLHVIVMELALLLWLHTQVLRCQRNKFPV
jgi:hypothetical protein